MKYMLLLNSEPAAVPTQGTTEAEEMMGRWSAYSEALTKAGAMVGGEAPLGTDTATTVRVRNGQRTTTDGPFIESKEVLGGYYVIDVADLDAAIEVRPVMQLPF